MPRAAQSDTNKKELVKFKWTKMRLGAVAVLVLALAVVGYFSARKFSGLGEGGVSTYQAVFLANGQVYFGKMTEKKDTIVLRDVYYLQINQSSQRVTSDNSEGATDSSSLLSNPANASPQNIQLVKLGSELHGPKDLMYIQKQNVLFWEDMKSDSRVVDAIRQYKDTQSGKPRSIDASGENKF